MIIEEKIKRRIDTAEELAMNDLNSGISRRHMKKVLEMLVEEENYSGAEGVKRALNKKLIVHL